VSIVLPTDLPGRTLIMIHGRGWKPEARALESLWLRALAGGLQRDYKKAGGAERLESVHKHFVYFGDLNGAVPGIRQEPHDADLDLQDREHALARLLPLKNIKRFRRMHYEELPGKSSLKEFLADLVAPFMNVMGLAGRMLQKTMPDVAAYLDPDQPFRTIAQQRLLESLHPALARGDDILLISHCLGSIVAYDVLWRLSHEPALAETLGSHRVRTWITLGSPLADEYVKTALCGARERPERRYPRMAVNWYNVAAEDDYTCHDETIVNDFRQMLDQRLISEIRDYVIYNLAVRYGRSNPHSSVGYLIHPRTTRLLGDWLGLDR